MKKVLLVFAGLALGALTASAQSQTITGTLIDNACFKPTMTQAELAKHTRECTMMENCTKSGYAVVTTDGKFYRLDTKGNAETVTALKASSKANDLKVTVTGAVKNDTIAVASIVLDK